MPELIDRLAADLAAVRWPDATEIRSRARRRRRRRVGVASGLAAVMAIAVALPFTVSGDDSGPPVATTERLVVIPPEAFLQPEDVGPGLISRRETAEEERPMAARRQQFVERSCPAAEPLNLYNALYLSQRTNSLRMTPSDPYDSSSGAAVLSQSVVRLDDGRAAQLADDLRRIGTICGNRVTTDTVHDAKGAFTYRTTRRTQISEEGFAGDQSFVFTAYAEYVRLDESDEPFLRPSSGSQAVVRVGDLVTVITWPDAVEPSEARRLAARAASWLCVASNPPC